ncbi:MAG: AsmA-like C-terminal domain-containing protein [Thermodesulfobacteriota bacterium]|nr:AsmA-like C-terminal domain-containing protein [Thermodesulfobacteriota bacterium]
MNKTKKIFLLAARGIGILLIVFLIFILVSPMLINLESAKEKILVHFSEQTGGELLYEKIDLLYFPRPHAVIYQVSLSIPGNITGTLANLKVYPAIFSLFTGDVKISKLQLITPNFNIKLPFRQKEKRIAISPSFAKEMLTNVLAYPALNKSSFLIEVKDGRLNLYDENDVSFIFININAKTRLLLNRFTINLACKSNLWKNITIKGLINPHLFAGKGQVDLTLFNPKILTDYLFPDTVLKVSDAGINLNLDFKSDKHHELHAQVQSYTSHLTLLHKNENVVIKAKNLICKLNMDEEKTKVSLSNLVLDYPKLRASGQFLLDRMVKQTSLDIDVKKADVGSTRKVALALAGNSGITKDIFDIVKGGSIPEITFKSFGKFPSDLGKMENIFIRGRLRDGNIFVPAALLDLEDVDGSVTISNGILVGENIKARLGNSFGTKGMLELGFEKNIPFYVETVIQADLAQLPPILERLVENKPFLKELSQIEELKGSALGKMVLDGNKQSVDVGVYASKINLRAHYGRIPYPLQIKGERFAYKGTQISFDKLNAVIGKSSFSQLSGGITWKDEPHLTVKSDSSILEMEEIYPWLLSYENTADVFNDFEITQGIITLSVINLNGPASSPMNWRINMKGNLENILINSSMSPDSISVADGKFAVIESTIPGTVKNNFIIEYANLEWGNSSFTSEGSIIFSEEGLWLYSELSADEIGWDKVYQIIEYINNKQDPMQNEKPWTLPVEGVFRIKSDYFTWGDLTFNPAHADIFLKNNEVFIDFTKANLCGISVPGSIKISSTKLELYLYPVAENRQLDNTVTCHWKKNRLVTGNFDLSGKLFAISDSKEVGKVLNGNLKFHAKDGRIYRYGILSKIFAILNVTEIFRGKLPDVVKEGFAYSSIEAEGDVKKGKFSFKECVIDGSSMTIVCEGYIDLIREKMDLVVLVAPFKTVDSIIKNIPLVNHVFGDKLVSIPFRVTGNPANPTVTPLSPADVGAGVLGLLKRTFTLPIKLFQPIFPEKNKRETEPTDEQKFP